VSRDRKLADSAARFHRPRAWTAQYLHKVEAQNRFCAESLCFHLRSELRRAGRLVDIGGGHGQFTRAAQTTNPRLAATIVDLPDAIDHCRTRMREEPFPGPVVFEVRDARTFDRPETFDVAIISDLLHYFTGPEKREVVGRALCSLVADGVLAIAKFRLDRSGDGPPAAVFFSMQKYLETPNAAFLETDEECRTILQEAGARDIRVIALSEDKTLVTGRKRG
jgi:SAM-dependent methyltransferase